MDLQNLDMPKNVVVGMSGGVDSTVTAYLLKQQGFKVQGIMLSTWKEESQKPGFKNEIDSAYASAKEIGVDFDVLECEDTFYEKIIDDLFINEYLQGRTPNPCVYCNYLIKWKYLLDVAKEKDYYYLATGHYADAIKLPNGRYSIQNAKFARKDQTYVLYHLSQEILSRILFPLAEYDKSQVREIAAKAGLQVATKKDSQDICFICDNYQAFMDRVVPESKKLKTIGNFVLEDGTVLGQHKGIYNYTIGQRKGLGLAMGERYFVKELDKSTNNVILAHESAIFKDEFLAKNINLISVDKLDEPLEVLAKLRYQHKPAEAVISYVEGVEPMLKCKLKTPERAVTPGQACVFYKDGHIVAGGIIDEIVS